MPDAEFVSMPVMNGFACLVKRPEEFLVPPERGRSSLAIGAAPDPETGDRGLMYIGIVADDGSLVTAIITEEQLPALGDLLTSAARQMATGKYDSPVAGGRQ